MKHIDLFSGIGGFALAASRVWGGDYQNVLFCDFDKFCQEVLKKNFGKEIKIYGDIRTVSRERLIADTNSNGQQGRENEIYTAKTRKQAQHRAARCCRTSPDSNDRRPPVGKQQTAGNKQCDFTVDLLTGGFPCQPFSQAGKRRGTEDNRFLWPEMLRVIKEFRPTWIIGENVAGILSVVEPNGSTRVALQTDIFGDENEEVRDYETVIGRIERELGEAGYETIWFVIPACAVAAPHRRDRVWIVGHLNSDTKSCGHGGCASEKCGVDERKIQPEEQSRDKVWGKGERRCVLANHPIVQGLQGHTGNEEGKAGRQESSGSTSPTSWERSWLEVATELCGVANGLPAELDGLKLSASKHREQRLKSLGNAIVPQVAEEIMRAIKEVMK